jgi:hypothetical protein
MGGILRRRYAWKVGGSVPDADNAEREFRHAADVAGAVDRDDTQLVPAKGQIREWLKRSRARVPEGAVNRATEAKLTRSRSIVSRTEGKHGT